MRIRSADRDAPRHTPRTDRYAQQDARPLTGPTRSRSVRLVITWYQIREVVTGPHETSLDAPSDAPPSAGRASRRTARPADRSRDGRKATRQVRSADSVRCGRSVRFWRRRGNGPFSSATWHVVSSPEARSSPFRVPGHHAQAHCCRHDDGGGPARPHRPSTRRREPPPPTLHQPSTDTVVGAPVEDYTTQTRAASPRSGISAT